MVLDVGPIVLRPMRAADRDSLITLLTDPDVMRHALEDRAYRRDEAESLLLSLFAGANDVFGMHALSLNLNSDAIGFSGYRRCVLLDAEDVEFGWVIATEHHGRGFATAIGHGLIKHAFRTLKLPRILAACHPANVVSEHILRDKLRMRFEREVEPRPNSQRRVYSAYA